MTLEDQRNATPDWRALGATPVLPVRDTADACAFYREAAGFRTVHREAGYAILARDAVEIHLWRAGDESWRDRGGDPPIVSGAESFLAGTASCRVRVDGPAALEAVHARCQAAGVVHPNGPLQDKPYGLREFAILDRDGNLTTFFTPTPAPTPTD